MSDGAEVRYAGRLFQRLAAETGKVCQPKVSWHYQLDDRSLNRDGTSASLVK